MNQVELLSDRIAAVQLDRKRNRELQRRERIFNDKVRTIGVSVCWRHHYTAVNDIYNCVLLISILDSSTRMLSTIKLKNEERKTNEKQMNWKSMVSCVRSRTCNSPNKSIIFNFQKCNNDFLKYKYNFKVSSGSIISKYLIIHWQVQVFVILFLFLLWCCT